MPMFVDCPEEAERYRRDFVDYWEKAVRYVYGVIIQTVGNVVDPRDKISLIKRMTKIKPPIQFNDENDDNMAKRHAVKNYLIERIQSGYVPTLDGVLENVKAHPTYASVSFEIG
jgi:hypothetical protein